VVDNPEVMLAGSSQGQASFSESGVVVIVETSASSRPIGAWTGHPRLPSFKDLTVASWCRDSRSNAAVRFVEATAREPKCRSFDCVDRIRDQLRSGWHLWGCEGRSVGEKLPSGGQFGSLEWAESAGRGTRVGVRGM